MHVHFPKLDLNSIRLVRYSDATFASNYDLPWQLGRVTLPMGGNTSAIPISLKSYKSRRVTRSILSAEVIAFSDLSDDAFVIWSQIEHALSRAVTMHLLPNSK